MEGLTRLVTESLARHGFDRPLDYRRLHWSRWFRCDSHHSLLFVPSKPGVFALAEEIADLPAPQALEQEQHFTAPSSASTAEERRFTAAFGASTAEERRFTATSDASTVEERRFSAASSAQKNAALAAEGNTPRRMLAVTQFFEDDDMAFVLDRMLSRQNVMSSRLTSGRYFVRFVVVEDQTQRRSVCAALNQWILSSAEKATGIGSHFAASLELTPATEYIPTANVSSSPQAAASPLDSGAAANIHCPSTLPSGF